MIQFKSLETYVLGTRKVFVVENDIDRDRDKNELIGAEVEIDGRKYEIAGVESFAVPVIHKGQKIGLLVKV